MHEFVSENLLNRVPKLPSLGTDAFAVYPAAEGDSFAPEAGVFRKASCACGGGCPACQAKSNLNISQPNDPAEIEADQVADKVMRMPVGEGQPVTNDGRESNMLNRKANPISAPWEPPSSIFGSSGRKLDAAAREFFEPRFGRDLSSVRIHTGIESAQTANDISATAFTLGNNIGFARGKYDPSSEKGKHLLAHELAHTGQSNGVIRRQPAPTITEDVTVKDVPPGGLQLRMTPKVVDKPVPNTGPGDPVNNGDKVIVKKWLKVSKWAWIEVPGKSSRNKDYPVLHGYIQNSFLNPELTASETTITKDTPTGAANTGDAKLDSLLGMVDDVPSKAPPLNTYNEYKANKDAKFTEKEYQTNFIKGEADKPYPGFSIGWDYDRNTMKIDADFQLTGTGATAQIAKTVEAGIKKFWNVKFGNFKLTTNVKVSFDPSGTIAPEKAIIELFQDPSKPSQLVKIGSGKPGNRKITLNTTTWDINWTPAHEFGHYIGMDDKYTRKSGGGTVAIPGWEKNMMAENNGTLSMWNIIELSLWWANWAK